MSTHYISATELKKNISDVLNRVYYKGEETLVKRHNEVIAKIIPVAKEKNLPDKKVLLKKYFGIMPDFPDITGMRHFRKRKTTL